MKIEKFLDESPIFSTLILYDNLVRKTSDRLKNENLGLLDALILVAVAMEQSTVYPSLLAKAFRMKRTNLSHSINYLVKRGLLTQDLDLIDRRKLILKATSDAKKVVNRLLKFFDEDQSHFEKIFGKHGIRTLRLMARRAG